MTDGPGIVPDDVGGLADMPDEPVLRLEASRSLSEIAALVLDAAVPGFADAAGVFVLETLLENGGVARPVGSGGMLARRLGTRFADPPRASKTLPPGEVLAFAESSPYAHCVREGMPVVFGKPDSQTLVQARPSGREVLGRYASFLAVPMPAHDAVTGFVVFSREEAAAFAELDRLTAARLTARAGTGVDAALALMRERTVTRALQRGLLTAAPVIPAGLEAAGRCLPADGHAVGGDWYDVVPLSSGAAGLTVGDVMGHGPAAAALMAQLRAAGHALAGLGLQPAALLRQLSGTAATLRNLTLATCVHAVIDPRARMCMISAAGHLPPVLALPDGTTRVPDLPSGPSFGLNPEARYGEARLKLPAGAVLALYTDGLAETRTRPFDQGIAALQAVLAKHRREPLEIIADLVVESLAASREDDVTILLARIPEMAANLRTAWGSRARLAFSTGSTSRACDSDLCSLNLTSTKLATGYDLWPGLRSRDQVLRDGESAEYPENLQALRDYLTDILRHEHGFPISAAGLVIALTGFDEFAKEIPDLACGLLDVISELSRIALGGR